MGGASSIHISKADKRILTMKYGSYRAVPHSNGAKHLKFTEAKHMMPFKTKLQQMVDRVVWFPIKPEDISKRNFKKMIISSMFLKVNFKTSGASKSSSSSLETICKRGGLLAYIAIADEGSAYLEVERIQCTSTVDTQGRLASETDKNTSKIMVPPGYHAT